MDRKFAQKQRQVCHQKERRQKHAPRFIEPAIEDEMIYNYDDTAFELEKLESLLTLRAEIEKRYWNHCFHEVIWELKQHNMYLT